jgi:hypothetical protein
MLTSSKISVAHFDSASDVSKPNGVRVQLTILALIVWQDKTPFKLAGLTLHFYNLISYLNL